MKYFNSHNARYILLSLLYTILFLCYYGIIFQTADQGEHLSLVYKLLQPELFKKDFYVQHATDTVTIRYVYVHTLSFISKLIPIKIAVYGLLFICIYASIRACIALSNLIYDNKSSLNLAPFFIFFVFYYWTIGGNSIQYNLLISSSFAKAFSLWAIYFFLRRRYIITGILLGIAGNFQLLVGLQLFVIFLGVIILEKIFLKNTPLKSILVLAVGYLGLSSWLLVRIVQQQFLAPQCDETLFYTILYRFRNPQHYIPSLFPIQDYLKLSILLATGTVIIFIYAKKQYYSRILFFNTVIVIGLITYSICIEFLGINAIGKSQFFKSTIWLQMISSLSIASYIHHKILYNKILYNITMIILLFIYFVFQTYKGNTSWHWDTRSSQLKDLTSMHDYIYNYTPVDAMALTFPKDESFICEAKRSQYVAFNPIIHESCYMQEWLRRYEHLLDHRINMDSIGNQGWDYLQNQYPSMVNRHYKEFDYILLPKNSIKDIAIIKHLELQFSSKFYTLYKTKSKH